MKRKLIMYLLLVICVIFSSCRPSPALIVSSNAQQKPSQDIVESKNENSEPNNSEPNNSQPELPNLDVSQSVTNVPAQSKQEEPESEIESAEAAPVDEVTVPNIETQATPEIEKTPTRQIYDSRGRLVDLPEEVSKIAVSSADAAIVGMMGAIQTIVATSADTQTGFFQKVFPELTSANVVWSGSNLHSTKDSGFADLLSAAPEAVLCYSDTFSEAQLETLQNNNIAVVVLPSTEGRFEDISNPQYLSYNSLKQKVKIIGQVLGNNAIQTANQYITYINSVIKEMERNFNYNWNTSFDPLASSYGSRMATAYISHYQNSGGISIYGESNNLFTAALQMAGVANSRAKSSVDGQSGDNYVNVDVMNFDTLILGTQNAKKFHSYICWGLTELNSNVKIQCGEMRQFVNPSGVTSWLEAGPESILEPLWLAGVFHPDSEMFGGENYRNYVKNKIAEFYSTFYKYELTSDELTQIMEGPQS